MGSEKPDLKMVHWENHPHEQKSQKEYVYKRFMKIWRDYAHKILTPRSTQKPHSLWKSINLHNLLSGALRKPPSRVEFSKRTWFLGILSLNLLKNHILFGNGLWKVQIWKWCIEKTTLTSRNLKKNMYIKGSWKYEKIMPTRSLRLDLLKNHIHCGSL